MFISSSRNLIKPHIKKQISLTLRKLSVTDNENEYEDNKNYSEEFVNKETWFKTLTYNDLPDETLYIMDGTAMLYNAFYRYL